MLHQGTVAQLRNLEIQRGSQYLAITMRTYPRGIKKELSDEYMSCLAPDPSLFKEFKALQKTRGHERAFQECDYENKFRISQLAFYHLKRLADISKSQETYLICQCELGQRCHRELLLIIAHQEFGAQIGALFHEYPTFRDRLAQKSYLTTSSFW